MLLFFGLWVCLLVLLDNHIGTLSLSGYKWAQMDGTIQLDIRSIEDSLEEFGDYLEIYIRSHYGIVVVL